MSSKMQIAAAGVFMLLLAGCASRMAITGKVVQPQGERLPADYRVKIYTEPYTSSVYAKPDGSFRLTKKLFLLQPYAVVAAVEGQPMLTGKVTGVQLQDDQPVCSIFIELGNSLDSEAAKDYQLKPPEPGGGEVKPGDPH